MALIPPIVTVMEKACKNASKSLIRDFGEHAHKIIPVIYKNNIQEILSSIK